MKPYQLYVFDMDGVLFRGQQVIEGAPEVIEKLQSKGAQIRYLTNNSSQTRRSFCEKLRSMNYDATPESIYTSAAGAASFVSGKRVFVLGEPGLVEELLAQGCVITDDNPEWVVVGICWSATYDMLDNAQWLIRNGARFLATNLDATYPIENGRLKPGAGALVAAVAAAAGIEPHVSIGKPEPALLEMIWRDTASAKSGTLLVGDRLDTDVVCAHRAGCDSALVLSGVSTRSEAASHSPPPTYILDDIAMLAME